MGSSLRSKLIAIVLVWLVVVLSMLGGPAFGDIATTALFFAFLATSWNLTGAYGGKLSLGHSIFFGIGAYTSTILLTNYGVSPWLGMLVGSLLAAATGAFIGWLSSRYEVSGIFFAMVTLSLTLLAVQLASNLSFLGAARGILLPLLGTDIGMFQFRSVWPFTVIAGAMTTMVLIYTWWYRTHRIGRWVAASALNVRASEASGVSPAIASMMGLSVSGAFAALGGTFYAQRNLYIDPHASFHWSLALAILLPAIVGGRSRAEGPLIGALLLIPVEQSLRIWAPPGVNGILLGASLMLLVLYLPRGVMPTLAVGASRLEDLYRERQKSRGQHGHS